MRYLIIAMFLISCGSEQRERFVCTCEQREKIAVFVSANIKDANNMSDEEMEDVISELGRTGIKLYCDQKPIWVDHNGNIDFEKQKLDSCQNVLTLY